MTPTVGVVGASARAAVHSLARAGFGAWAVDLFADRDLKRISDCVACPFDAYPDALPALAARFPPGPVLYTGGLENHPRVVSELASARELWGNPPEVLARIRDPHTLFPALAAARFAAPAVVPPGAPAPAAGRWLRKLLRSSAGLGIRLAAPGEVPSPNHYFQEFIDGPAMSALYSDTMLLGVTEQLVGEPWLHARPFAYCGSVGRVASGLDWGARLIHLGIVLAAEFGLRGVWNVDLVLRGTTPYPVEVNPRYSASVEVIEHATGAAVFGDPSPNPSPVGPASRASLALRSRLDAGEGGGALKPPSRPGKGVEGLGSPIIGKAIYYAPHRITFPAVGPWDADLTGLFDPWRLPNFPDIPEPGAAIEPGWPVVTVFASGSSPAAVREGLQSRAAELDALFAEARP
jgi:uncharacterized protein